MALGTGGAQQGEGLAGRAAMGEVGQPGRREPSVFGKSISSHPARDLRGPEHVKAQAPMAEEVFDLSRGLESGHRETDAFGEATAQAFAGRFASDDLTPGQFPEPAEEPSLSRPKSSQRRSALEPADESSLSLLSADTGCFLLELA